MKKFIIALATAIVICVPVLADNDPTFVSSFQLTHLNGSNPWYVTTYETDTAVTGDVYFYSKVMDGNSNIVELYAISETLNARAVATIVRVTDNNTSHQYYSCSTQSGDYYFSSRCTYWQTNLSDYIASPELAVFPASATNADIATAFNTFLNTPDTPAVASTFTVPSGNVLYFQVASEQDVDFDANMPRLSSPIFASQYGPWGNTGIKFGPVASLPTSGTTFPILSQDNIRWFVQAPTNVFGQSKIGTMQKHCIVGQWYALYCPDVFGLNETSADLDSNSTVPGASVKVSGSFAQIKVYPLTSTFDFSDGEFVTSSNDDFTSYFDGSIDENGAVTFTDQNGDVNSPVSGGQNFQDYETDPFALVENIKTILTNILSEIKSLFTFGYDAIQSLVNIMSDFVNVFQQLYTWLPSEVYTALVSAIIVAITIGVFKVFL